MCVKSRRKRYIEIGILILMTILIVKTGNEQALYPQQERQSGQGSYSGQSLQAQQDLQTGQSLQPWQCLQSEQISRSQHSPKSGQKPQSEKHIAGPDAEAGIQNDIPEEPAGMDDAFYVQCIQNLHQGNSMTYADGYYYYRSQTENYSLCRTGGTGMPVEVVADQVPGAVYIREDQVYFINVSDNRTLYAVGTDGEGLRKLSDFPMQELVVIGDRIYFRSVYDREYDPFYQLIEDEAEDDRYLYSMNLDGSDCRLLVPKVCREFTADGEQLYYLACDEEEKLALYKINPDGTAEEKIHRCEHWIENLLSYQDNLYWVDGPDHRLIRLKEQGEEEVLAEDVICFTISGGQVYAANEHRIRILDLRTGTTRDYDVGCEDTFPWYYGAFNRGIFLVNGQLFARYFESDEKGVLWHVWDEEKEKFVVFEDIESLDAERLVADSSFCFGEHTYYYPGWEDGSAEKFLDADGELCYEESCMTREDGSTYGDFSITLPKFNSDLSSCEQMNQQMEKLLELAMEDKDAFFQEIREREDPESCFGWHLYHGYRNCYIGEKYISMFCYRDEYRGGVRAWRQPLPLIFDRETGKLLHMDDLFTVERSFYLKRLTGIIYKYCEMTGHDHWNDAFDNNVLVNNLGEFSIYLTENGIVLCYERYAIQAGASGSPTFEIPYEQFADIFRQ